MRACVRACVCVYMYLYEKIVTGQRQTSCYRSETSEMLSAKDKRLGVAVRDSVIHARFM